MVLTRIKTIGAAALLAAALLVPSAFAAPPEDGIQLHLSWTSPDAHKHMTATWWSATSYTPTVEYGETDALGMTATGDSVSLGVESGIGFIHRVTMEGLKANTTYHYRVGNGGSQQSRIFTFVTAPTPGTAAAPMTFIAVGDMGISSRARSNISRMMGIQARFLLHAGDFSYETDSAGWNTWFNQVEPVAAAVPYMVAVGNHDDDDNYSWYKRRFTLGGVDGRWYSFRYGRIYVIALDANTPTNSQQLDFLEAEMTAIAARTDIDWRIAFFHQPAYSSNTAHGSNLTVRANFTPELDRGKIDLVLQGHDHSYERTRPVRFSAQVVDTPGPDYVDPTAPIYVVTGGGGAGLYTSFSSEPWSQVAEATHHFMKLTVTGDRLEAEAIRTSDGVVFDRFSIRKSSLTVDAGAGDVTDGGPEDAGSGGGVVIPPVAGGGAPVVGPEKGCGCHATSGAGLVGLWFVIPLWAIRRKR